MYTCMNETQLELLHGIAHREGEEKYSLVYVPVLAKNVSSTVNNFVWHLLF